VEPLRSAEPSAASERKIGLFGARSAARDAQSEVDRLRGELARTGALEAADLKAETERLREVLTTTRSKLQGEVFALETQLASLKTSIVATEEEAALQELGLYSYRHPLDDSVAYKSEIQRIKERSKVMARNGQAVHGSTNWTVNNSAAQGRKMVSDFSKLMLRAYNADADTLARGMKPYKLASAVDRLEKTVATIERLGKTMAIRIAPEYHRLRVKELELAADYQEKLAEERERERAAREQLREEAKVQAEIAREREKLAKQHSQTEIALARAREMGDSATIAVMEAKLADIDQAVLEVDRRAQNFRLGFVYVISNVGAFGPGTVKIGMTRRQEPMDRVRELGDASVPFAFDVHAIVYSEDAVALETALHQRFADRRINRINLRREFFRATPAEVRQALVELEGHLVTFEEYPEAVEFRKSEAIRERVV
jgi:hypothetical protein